MTFSDVPLVVSAGLAYARYKRSDPAAALRGLVDAGPGRAELSAAERRRALRIEAGLRRLGVRCLARSVVVARDLRSQGVAAAVSVSVSAADPRSAHAEVTVGGRPLHPHPAGNVVFR